VPVVLLLLVGFVIFALWVARAGELFLVSLRNGQVLLVRGRVPQGLLGDFREVVARPPVMRATIRAVRAAEGARLLVLGDIDAGRHQRLRNTFALRPVSALRAAPVADDRSIGQVLGIVWLAWLLHGGRRGT
jgi:hypothetical protein